MDYSPSPKTVEFAHGGSIRADSLPGRGTIFTASLPL